MDKTKLLPLALFTSNDGVTRIQAHLQDENLWLTQKQIAELFEKSLPTINEHLKNIYEEGELEPDSTIRKFRIVALEGKRDVERLLDHYNLEAILAVGYRVRSNRGVQFRKWATEVLKEYLVKGFAMDDERLKNPDRSVSADYYDELLERIRDIRASERRFYQKITDIYATATDYSSKAQISQQFFASVQNKLHWAIHGHTAAELIAERVDIDKPNIGVTNFSGKQVTRKDVSVAKNYLSQDELKELNRIVTMYLDYAEDQAQKQNPMTMQTWVNKLDAFLAFNDRNVLNNAGKISHEVAKQLAEDVYDGFVEKRRAITDAQASDFDQFVNDVAQIKNKPEDNKG